MKIAYIVTLFISDKSTSFYDSDMDMAKNCFESLTFSEDVHLFIFNQGCLSEDEIHDLLKPYNFQYNILGYGKNVGIPKGRYKTIKYILDNFPNIEYLAEIHLDMIFMSNWHIPLINYLQSNDEPMVCPRIIEDRFNGLTIQDNGTHITLPPNLSEKVEALKNFVEDKVIFNFTNPVIYRAETLKGVNFYDIGFLTGKQNFEDTSLLIGFRYYMGTRTNWRPKCCLNSCVYHKIEGQRLRVTLSDDYSKNLEGLKAQYGAYGILEWYRMDGNELWNQTFQNMIIDKNAYEDD